MGKKLNIAAMAALPIAAAVLAPTLRRRVVVQPLMSAAKRHRLVPRISRTELAALAAGDTWIEERLFRGEGFSKEDFSGLPADELTREEREFLNGPVERLCAMVSDWQVWRDRDLPKEAWDFIRTKGFLGMIIPRQYGGLGFSAAAHSAVIKKLHSRSVPLSITVMVPNSLGPAELLLHYGTEEQKIRYLPRLASGRDIPCFALTEPEAGSDAASLRSSGEVFEGADGKLYLRLNWEKRWITLAAVSSLIGLAFRLRDPENLLGRGAEVGITCALVPRDAPGVVLDRRHDPMGVPFFNSPIFGRDVIVPVEAIIGGKEGAGHGWKMVMESLAAGRGISLPAQCAGGAALAARVASAHAVVRRQFGRPIGRFEGVAEVLGEMGGLAYAIEALRLLTCAGIDSGRRPAVVTAIAKYHSTELYRSLINHGMDVLGGVGLSLGPRNLLAHSYFAAPISITVEGANILTRSLIVFGQGLLRLHPCIAGEVKALEKDDVHELDQALVRHFAYVLGVLRRVIVPGARLGRASAGFALLSELSILTLGGSLKVRESLSGRLADALGWLYMVVALEYRFQRDGSLKEDLPFLEWGREYAFGEIEKAFQGISRNHPSFVIGLLMRLGWRLASGGMRIGRGPSDRQTRAVAKLLMQPGRQRERLFGGIYIPQDEREQLARLETAMKLSVESAPVEKKQAEGSPLSEREHEHLELAKRARQECIQVDAFLFEEYRRGGKRAA